MPSLRWIAVPLALALSLPSMGCGLFRRNKTTTNVSSSVQINDQGRDVATLQRDEYEVIGTSMGQDKSTQVFFLTIPMGSQTGAAEGAENAYYDAVDRDPQCDALLMPRAATKRIVIPLIIINIVIRKNRVKGRCIHVLENDQLDGEASAEQPGASDTGGGGDGAPADGGGAPADGGGEPG